MNCEFHLVSVALHQLTRVNYKARKMPYEETKTEIDRAGLYLKFVESLPVFGIHLTVLELLPPLRCVLEPTQGTMLPLKKCQSSKVLVMLREKQLVCCLLCFLT